MLAITAMQVSERLTYAEYWNDERFRCKKPVMNGSLKQKYGDNIYRFDEARQKLVQVDSHHSLEDGSTNERNYKRDTSGKCVLISTLFWFFGKIARVIPEQLADIVHHGIGHKKVSDLVLIDALAAWLSGSHAAGYCGEPRLFHGEFRRYSGIGASVGRTAFQT